jgi:farnesyl-diphosphate farnesyltransferase
MQAQGPFPAELADILRGVSRSFGLSIRLLPARLRPGIALAYLLARATDTVADTASAPLPERLDLLEQILNAVQGTPRVPAATLAARLQSFAQPPGHADERRLLHALPACLDLLSAWPADDQASVRQVLQHIGHGQRLDLERGKTGTACLQTEAELEQYTWLVAGSVGAFWTNMCARHLPDFASLPDAHMSALGQRYGTGLQRLNILRDAGKDLADGRCYLPAETLACVGLSPQQLATAVQQRDLQTLAPLQALLQHWREDTLARLGDGLRYSCALHSFRLRLASALPALLGACTLALLAERGLHALFEPVKVPRQQVHRLLLRLLLHRASPRELERQFQRLGGVTIAP